MRNDDPGARSSNREICARLPLQNMLPHPRGQKGRWLMLVKLQTWSGGACLPDWEKGGGGKLLREGLLIYWANDLNKVYNYTSPPKHSRELTKVNGKKRVVCKWWLEVRLGSGYNNGLIQRSDGTGWISVLLSFAVNMIPSWSKAKKAVTWPHS